MLITKKLILFVLLFVVLGKLGGTSASEVANQYLDTEWFRNWADAYPKFTLDNRVVLLGLKTIRFARIKATEMAAVSDDVKYCM